LDLKKRRGKSSGEYGWQSPDRGDAAALCFATAGPRYLPVAAAGEAREAWS